MVFDIVVVSGADEKEEPKRRKLKIALIRGSRKSEGS